MKKFLSFFALLLLSSHYLMAQSFGVQYTNPDTVYFTYSGGNVIVEDSIHVPSGNVNLTWHVIGTDFPADWITGTAFCDNILCYILPVLWPSGSLDTSGAYYLGNNSFIMDLNFNGATSCGTHYVAIRMYNASIPTDTAREVFAVNYCPTVTGIANINNNNNVILYPNPASNSVNIIYSTAADVKVVAVYNMIGKMMLVNKVSGNSANINIENMSAGVYFMRLVNGDGGVVATRKFTKE